MLNVQSPTFLRRVLVADAATSLACGLLLTLGAGALAPLFGLPLALLREAGLLLFPFAALVLFAATRPTLPRALAWVIVISNALWAIDSVMLLLSGWVAPTALGQAFVLAQAVVVALFAELEFFGLRRSVAAAA
ncbi:MAG TPA: hypothetical protein VJ652_20490 [Noviherbaspirillum sp.]|nr:hypothetical protein [Noviherbaspirillum sp.]